MRKAVLKLPVAYLLVAGLAFRAGAAGTDKRDGDSVYLLPFFEILAKSPE